MEKEEEKEEEEEEEAIGVVQPLRRKNRIYCADSLEVLTDLACLTSSLRVPCQAWETCN